MRLRYIACCALMCCLFAISASAQQNVYGRIAGTVTDPSGAVISNAKVTVTNTDQHAVAGTATTDSSGNYSVTNLQVGHYTVSVEAQGFKSASISDIPLNVNDRRTENFQLSVGQSAESVNVNADAIQVQLQSPDAAGLITGAQVRDLQLNNRNYEQLVALQPGVSYGGGDQLYIGLQNPSGETNTVSFSINGQRNSGNNWTIDGADNVDRGSNLTLLNYPSVDAISEFKTERGLYSAEYGRSASGEINVITKSGTSSFHGDAYEFFRNDVLNANTYFNKLANPIIKRPALRYNDFGYTIGGPVYIPNVYNTDKNRTFFFFSQEYRRVGTFSSLLGDVPTAAERAGTFPTTVCTQVTVTAGTPSCAATGTQITNINPISQQYLNDVINKLPLPNDAASGDANAVLTPARSTFNNRQDLVRIDQNFGAKMNLFFRYINDTIPTIEPGGLFTGSALPAVAQTDTRSPGHTYMGHGTVTLSPTLLLDGGYAYSYGAIISRPVGLISSANSPDVKVGLAFPTTLTRIPALSFQGGSGITSFGPYNDFNRNHNPFLNVTKVIGNHNVRTGVTYNHYQKTENAGGNNAGTLAFRNFGRPAGTLSYTQSFANFLSGFTSTYTQDSLDLTPDIQTNQFEAYVQDEWRMRPSFTLSYGVRYSYFQQPYDANNFLTNFDPALYNPANAPTIDANGNICTVAPCAGGGTPNPNYDPLNGIIINGKNSPFGNRVGSTQKGNFAPRVGFAWDPWGNGRTAVRAGYGYAYDSTLFGVYEQNIFQNPPFVNSIAISNTFANALTGGTQVVSTAPKVLHATPVDYKTPYTSQWSLDIQQQVVHNFIVDVGYYGSKGTHLLGLTDINMPQAGAYVGAGLAPEVDAGNENVLNQIRPFLGYGPISQLRTGLDSNYHSLQASARYQFTGNSLIDANYTWSKCLTDAQTDRSSAPQNTYDLAAEYGPCQLDRRNVFTADYIYDFPFFRGQHNFLGYTLGGWEYSGIITANSGLPITVFSFGNGNSGDPAGQAVQGSTPATLRPDQISDPNQGAPHQFLQWFNTSAFADVPVGQARPGDAKRGSVVGPGFYRFDMALLKNIPIHESISAQFRAEFFNIFNHTNFNTVGGTLGSSTFGKVTSTRDPRIGQLALKIYF